ncbi:putative nucleotide kinase [Escherichia phage CLB_P1]|uniref:Putative nucleotide kinase n=1 Tax=Escherichia phage CLB_P1 TaxID=1262524 RepID=A0A7I6HEH5_9CAUD|nr:putative nucleotide kinase [Escherichia phage CLB_P1]
MTEQQVAIKLIELNPQAPNDQCCPGTTCPGISCDECPFDEGDLTFGDIRKQYAPKHTVEDDGVRKPSHYQVFDGVESIEIIARSMTVSEFRGFCMGNVLKYRLRAGKKSELATLEKDLNKAAFYQELFDLHKGKCYDSK